MGWFLSSKKKSSRTSKKRVEKPKDAAAKKRRLWAAARFLGVISLVAGSVFGWLYLEPLLVAEIRRSAPPPVKLELAGAPEFLKSSGLEAQFLLQADPLLRSDRFDYQGLRDVAALFRNSPWVEQLEGVTRHRDGRVEVRARYRTPAALVQQNGTYFLIDPAGIRLPMHPSRQIWNMAGVLIEGLSEQAPAEGRMWEGADLKAALHLADLIDRQDWADQIRSIDVSNYNGRHSRSEAQLTIGTLRGGLILWGRAPGEEGVFEPLATIKLQHLTQVQTAFSGAVDGGGPGWKIAVFGDTLEVMQPDMAQRSEAVYTR